MADGALDHPITIPRTDDDIDRLAQAFRPHAALGEGQDRAHRTPDPGAATAGQADPQADLSLQQADKLKDELLANTSHELRTPSTHQGDGRVHARQPAGLDRRAAETAGAHHQECRRPGAAGGRSAGLPPRCATASWRSTPAGLLQGGHRLVLDLCQHLVQAKPSPWWTSARRAAPCAGGRAAAGTGALQPGGQRHQVHPQGKVVLSAQVEGPVPAHSG
nr:hypothetical protein [Aeromonas caviae]